MDLINTPITRVSCLNMGNPENQADLILGIFTMLCSCVKIPTIDWIFDIQSTNSWYVGVYKVHGKSQLRGYKNRYEGSPFLIIDQ